MMDGQKPMEDQKPMGEMPEGQASEDESPKSFQKLIIDTHARLLKMLQIMQGAGIPEQALGAFQGLVSSYTDFFKGLSTGSQEAQPAPEPAPQGAAPRAPKGQPVPAESAGRGVPRL